MLLILMVIGAFYIGVMVNNLYEGYKQKRVRYKLKVSGEMFWRFALLVWSMYFIIGAVNLIPPIKMWVNTELLLPALSSEGKFLIGLMPFVFIITVIYIAIRAVAIKYPIKYSEQEIQWNQESDAKLATKHPVLRWVLRK